MNNWNVYQENICILGMQHSGKTTLAKSLLDSIPNVPRLIISPQQPEKLYGQYGNSISSIDELIEGGAYVWTGRINDKVFEKICNKMMTFSNMILVVDDAHEFCKKQKIPESWSTLINSGRSRGIVSIFISPSPNLLNNVLLQSSQHIISFRFNLESQIEYGRKNFFGDIGWLLLAPNLRPDKFQKYRKLDEHDYLYHNTGSEFIMYHSEDGNTLQLQTISDFPKDDNGIVQDIEPEKVDTEKQTIQEEEPIESVEPEKELDESKTDKDKEEPKND